MKPVEQVLAVLGKRHGGVELNGETMLNGIMDSLALLELFMLLESIKVNVNIGQVSACQTVGDLCRLVEG